MIDHCPCGFEGWEYGLFSAAWNRAHKDAHLAAYPNLDQGSIRNLEDFIVYAERREAGRAETCRYDCDEPVPEFDCWGRE